MHMMLIKSTGQRQDLPRTTSDVILCGVVKQSQARSPVDPDVDEILLEVVARRQGPALYRARIDDDAVPPQEGHGVRLAECAAFEFADDLDALARVRRHSLADIKGIEKAVGRMRVVHG